jgi:hypothetical protein
MLKILSTGAEEEGMLRMSIASEWVYSTNHNVVKFVEGGHGAFHPIT